MSLFRRRKVEEKKLSERELQILERELAESLKSAIPNETSSDSFGDGSSINNVSRIQATVNQKGMEGIVSRRVFEPRKGWNKSDKNQI
jgi:hypothetical protein